MKEKKYDVFICHASEDKTEIAIPLANRLLELGLKVWFDDFELTLGDNLRREIDYGLVKSKFGIVILSKEFFKKEWTQRELDALVAKEEGNEKVILPIWHKITKEDIVIFSPILAGRLSASTAQGLEYVANEIIRAVQKEDQRNVHQTKTRQDVKERYQTQVDTLRAILSEPLLYEFLANQYAKYEILERCGLKYPVAILDKTIRKLEDLDPIIMRPTKWHLEKSGFLIDNSEYRSFRSEAGAPIEPNETYRTVAIEQQGNKIGIHCDIGRYDLMMDTCDCLEWEILKVLSETPDWQTMPFESLFEKLQLRKYLHANVIDPVIDGRGRSAAIAVSVLTTFIDENATHHDGNRQFLWVRRRSRKGVAVNAGQMHVIPSFMFQPEQGYRDEEFNLLHNIRREFLEELFNVKAPKDALYNWFYKRKPVQYLNEMLKTGEAELWLTGVVVNLLNLRPEICVLLRIKTPKWYADHSSDELPHGEKIDICEEFDPNSAYNEDREENFVPRVPLFDKDKALLERANLYPGDTVPPGAAAFWLGIDALRKL